MVIIIIVTTAEKETNIKFISFINRFDTFYRAFGLAIFRTFYCSF